MTGQRRWDVAQQSDPDRPRDRIIVVQNQKNPGLAAVLSFVIPGLGQIYNGQFLKGLFIFFMFALSVAAMALIVGFLTAPLFWLWGIWDAYKTAEHKNRDAELRAYKSQ
jgi:TM2 domain-containing membrane protein YozV